MQLVSNYKFSASRFSLVVALLAAFAFASIQTAELSHQHLSDDVAENCVLCKTDSNQTLLIGSAHTVFSRFKPALNSVLVSSDSVDPFTDQRARAPPQHS